MTEDTQAQAQAQAEADGLRAMELDNKVQVFVTTKKIQSRLKDTLPVPSMGKWFQLNDYADKAAFMVSAQKYAVGELEDASPKLLFTHTEAGFYTKGLFADNNEPRDDLWEVFNLPNEDFTILAIYNRVVPMKGGVAASLAEAKRNYVGYFPTNKDFAIYKLRKAGMSDEALALIDDCCDFNKLAYTNTGSSYQYHKHIFRMFD